MSLTPGTRLGHYEVVGLIGAGGMGEVYEGHDPRLGRTVALKVLLEHMSSQPEARARFEREAQMIAALNHPHIATLHDVGRHGEIDFLVMELVQGETLAARLLRGPLPIHEVLRHGVDIADALDQAHRHDVIHRDLKPMNVMLTRTGVKLLDFGLAKFRQPRGTAGDAQVTRADITSAGEFLGTLQYMAPEQLEGSAVDGRTDIFAFGTMLHEMATGSKAFSAPSRMSLMRSIMSDTPPPVSTLQPLAPRALDRLIATCLAKDPDDRWQSARDIKRELSWILESSGPIAPPHSGEVLPPSGRRARALPWTAAGTLVLVTAAIAAAAVWTFKPAVAVAPLPVTRLAISLPAGDKIGNIGRPAVALSPDGTVLVYAAQRGGLSQLFMRPIGDLQERVIVGTDGASGPFFSPDGQWIGFFAAGKLKKVPASGGAIEVVCDAASSQGGTWAAGNVIYFAPFNTSGLWRVAATGGTPTQVTTLDRNKGEVSHRWPQVLPGGEAIIFTVWTGPGFDERQVHLQLLRTGERRVLLQGASTGRYVSSGHIIYARADALFVVPFDLAQLQVAGSGVPLTDRAYDDEGAHFDVSASGMLAYVPAAPTRYDRRLVWVDPSGGRIEALPLSPRAFTDPMLSPDGRNVAFTVIGAVEAIWIYDFARRTVTSLTSTAAGSSQAPTWSPDGSQIIYRGTRGGFRNLFRKAVDGGGDEERLTTADSLQTPTSWSVDGKHLIFVDTTVGTGPDLAVLDTDTHEPRVFLRTAAGETNPRFSPDGRAVAYVSDESGANEVYVRAFPGPGRKLQVSPDGGVQPVWSRDGRQLYYRNADKMLSVDVATRPVVASGIPHTIFEGRYVGTDTGNAGYDVSASGRFLMVQPVVPEAPLTQINIVLGLFESLKRSARAGRP